MLSSAVLKEDKGGLLVFFKTFYSDKLHFVMLFFGNLITALKMHK